MDLSDFFYLAFFGGVTLYFGAVAIINYFTFKHYNRFSSDLKEEPAVDVLIPARNEEKNVEKCLETILNQNSARASSTDKAVPQRIHALLRRRYDLQTGFYPFFDFPHDSIESRYDFRLASALHKKQKHAVHPADCLSDFLLSAANRFDSETQKSSFGFRYRAIYLFSSKSSRCGRRLRSY